MDLPSDSDESDVDFVPEGELSHSDAESEAEADQEVDEQYEGELAKKNEKKRLAKASKKKPTKKAKLSEEKDVEKTAENKVDAASLNPEEVKQYEDNLWASFLGTPSQSSKPAAAKKSCEDEVLIKEKKSDSLLENGNEKSAPDIEEKVGKAIEKAEKDTPVEKPSPAPSTPGTAVPSRARSSLTPNVPFGKKPSGGLASVLDKLGKKDKLSTLEKSKLDWMSFKKDEGLDEEIQTFNRGKSGYLERQDFLQRSDVRQFEIEKNLRLNKRSNR